MKNTELERIVNWARVKPLIAGRRRRRGATWEVHQILWASSQLPPRDGVIARASSGVLPMFLEATRATEKRSISTTFGDLTSRRVRCKWIPTYDLYTYPYLSILNKKSFRLNVAKKRSLFIHIHS